MRTVNSVRAAGQEEHRDRRDESRDAAEHARLEIISVLHDPVEGERESN